MGRRETTLERAVREKGRASEEETLIMRCSSDRPAGSGDEEMQRDQDEKGLWL